MNTTKEIRLFKRLSDLEIECDKLRKKRIFSSSDMEKLKLLKIRKKAVNAMIRMQFESKSEPTIVVNDYKTKIYLTQESKKDLNIFVELGERNTCTLVYKVINDRLVSAKFTSHLGFVVEDLKAKLKDLQYSNLYR